MLTEPLPADLPYAVMFDAVCEDLPPPLQNPSLAVSVTSSSAEFASSAPA